MRHWEVLYAHKMFRFIIDLRLSKRGALSASISHRMMNIELYLVMSHDIGIQTRKKISTFQMDAAAGKIVTLFAGQCVSRKIISVKLQCYTHTYPQRLPPAFIRALKLLTTFAAVCIEVELHFVNQQRSMNGRLTVEMENQWANVCFYYLGRVLKPSLGPSTLGVVPSAHDVVFARSLTFHPRHFHAQQQVKEHVTLSNHMDEMSLHR